MSPPGLPDKDRPSPEITDTGAATGVRPRSDDFHALMDKYYDKYHAHNRIYEARIRQCQAPEASSHVPNSKTPSGAALKPGTNSAPSVPVSQSKSSQWLKDVGPTSPVSRYQVFVTQQREAAIGKSSTTAETPAYLDGNLSEEQRREHIKTAMMTDAGKSKPDGFPLVKPPLETVDHQQNTREATCELRTQATVPSDADTATNSKALVTKEIRTPSEPPLPWWELPENGKQHIRRMTVRDWLEYDCDEILQNLNRNCMVGDFIPPLHPQRLVLKVKALEQEYGRLVKVVRENGPKCCGECDDLLRRAYFASFNEEKDNKATEKGKEKEKGEEKDGDGDDDFRHGSDVMNRFLRGRSPSALPGKIWKLQEDNRSLREDRWVLFDKVDALTEKNSMLEAESKKLQDERRVVFLDMEDLRKKNSDLKSVLRAQKVHRHETPGLRVDEEAGRNEGTRQQQVGSGDDWLFVSEDGSDDDKKEEKALEEKHKEKMEALRLSQTQLRDGEVPGDG